MRDRDNDLKPYGLTPEASFYWDEHHGYNHLCVKCNKRSYKFGNMGLCSICVKEQNTDEKLKEELRSEIIEVSIGVGEINFLLEELRFIQFSHEGADYYNTRCDFVKRTLKEALKKK